MEIGRPSLSRGTVFFTGLYLCCLKPSVSADGAIRVYVSVVIVNLALCTEYMPALFAAF